MGSFLRALLVATTVCIVVTAHAQTTPPDNAPIDGRPFGIGIVAGEPSGLSAKSFLRDGHGVQFIVAWNFDLDRLWLSVDYLYHWLDVIDVRAEGIGLAPYVGIGGSVALRAHRDTNFGIRVPAGLSLMLADAHLEASMELVPGLLLIPESVFDLGGDFGLRYYF